MAKQPSTDHTLDPNLRSFVEAANDPTTDFPIQNLPFCSIDDPAANAQHTQDGDAPAGPTSPGRLCVAIGDSVLDLDMLMHAGLFDDATIDGEELDDDFFQELHDCLHYGGLQQLVAMDPVFARFLREQAQAFLLDGQPSGGQQARRLRQKALTPIKDAKLIAPLLPLNYTDFYASIDHAKTVGSMFRPDNPLLPNYKHVPIGYHGRASSIVVSGTPVKRPRGQQNIDNTPNPTFGPSKRLDYELEMGVIIGGGNDLGNPIPIAEADDAIFGLVIVNDWSARDMQAWEYQPLGPFLAKNFATSISPFVVSRDALAPFRIPGPLREAGDPAPLDYLSTASRSTGFDITLEVLITSKAMREKNLAPVRISKGDFSRMYWTFAQMIAHHTVNGCNLVPGDLLASGTISGSTPDSRGCLLESTWVGTGNDGKPLPRKAIELPTGEKRIFLEDGDEVIMRAWCEKPGFRKIGFGECRGVILPNA
jgi:fumarylacetoacetase